MAAQLWVYDYFTCGLTAEDWDQLRIPYLLTKKTGLLYLLISLHCICHQVNVIHVLECPKMNVQV